MLVIAFHEFGHAITAICTGGRVKSISLDPHEGGVTNMVGGSSAITLPAGYLGSSLIGALLIFCGFNIVASKIASIVLGVCFLLTLWWARKDWLTIVTILLAVGLLVGFWFIAHAEALRFLVVRFFPLSLHNFSLSLHNPYSLSYASNSTSPALHRRNVLPIQCMGYLRRSHLTKNQYFRRQCLCEALRRILSVLGRYLVFGLGGVYGGCYSRWTSCL